MSDRALSEVFNANRHEILQAYRREEFKHAYVV
jgi:hypothetical protein